MQTTPSQGNQTRSRFRSFKYSISGRGSQKKHSLQPRSKPFRRDSIINPGKLDSLLKPRNTAHSQTLALSNRPEDNIYVRTFTTFFSRELGRDRDTEDKENAKFKVLIPEYDHEFDEREESDFTFLDSMVKPARFVENQLVLAEKELKRQRNDLDMLRAEMAALKKLNNQRLQDITTTVRTKMEQLKQTLRSSEVLQNERKLRSRKEVRLLESGQELQWRMMESLKERNLDIQQRIFACHPLELEFQKAPVLEIDNEYL